MILYREEINVIRKTCNFRAFKISFFFTASRLIQLVTFLVFGLTGHSVTAENAFLVVSMFNTVRRSMTLFFPMALSQLREVRASVRRIQVIKMTSDDISQRSSVELPPAGGESSDLTKYWPDGQFEERQS